MHLSLSLFSSSSSSAFSCLLLLRRLLLLILLIKYESYADVWSLFFVQPMQPSLLRCLLIIVFLVFPPPLSYSYYSHSTVSSSSSSEPHPSPSYSKCWINIPIIPLRIVIISRLRCRLLLESSSSYSSKRTKPFSSSYRHHPASSLPCNQFACSDSNRNACSLQPVKDVLSGCVPIPYG